MPPSELSIDGDDGIGPGAPDGLEPSLTVPPALPPEIGAPQRTHALASSAFGVPQDPQFMPGSIIEKAGECPIG